MPNTAETATETDAPETDAPTPEPEIEYKLVTTLGQMAPPADLDRKECRVPELRQRFLFQELTALQAATMRKSNAENRDLLMVVHSMVDHHGNRFFPDEAKGIKHLEQYGLKVIARLVTTAQLANTLLIDDDPVSDAEGNS